MQLKALAESAGDTVGQVQARLAKLCVRRSDHGLPAGNSVNSPASLLVGIAHVNEPNTPNASAISALDSFTVAPAGRSAGRTKSRSWPMGAE